MLCLTLTLLYILILYVDTVFIKSREPDTWENAREYCTSFGGHLATLNDIGRFRDDVQRREVILAPGEELWVGASLKYGPWTWKGESELIFKERHFSRKGCLRLDTDNNGTWMESPTPLKCLDHCGWRDQVGLKENYCYCDEDLRNVSTNRHGVCHIRCNSTSNMCGGYNAISMYMPGKRDLTWAEGEPKDDNDCALLRIDGKATSPELVTSNCDMQTRYLCTFMDNDKCGFQNECVRASTFYSTWNGAINKCEDVNGTFSQLQEPLADDILNDLHGLPRGSFWVALHRSRHWQWLNGQKVDPTSFHAGRRFVLSQTCATVKMIGQLPTLTGRQCQQRLHFVCQYDYMAKREDSDKSGNRSDLLGDGVTPIYGLMSDDAGVGNVLTTDENPPETESNSEGMYMVLGFMSGMVCVLILGLVVYLICRCRQPSDDNKHQRLDGQPGRPDTQSVSYSSKDDSIHISPPITDITYDTVYDLETESPFRRTQRLIRMGSANSWRHAPPRRGENPNATPSPRTGYTWRGMIGGGIEIINTELRHPVSNQSDYREASTASLYDGASYNRTRAVIENRRGSSPNEFDQIEVLYDLPERSDSFDYESRKAQREKKQEEEDASFLELRTARNSGSHEENIYATIKKTFQKIEEEIAEQARKDNADNPDKNK